MKQDYEGQGLKRFNWTLVTLGVSGALTVLGWSVYAIWRALT